MTFHLRPETPDDLAFLQRLYVWNHWDDLKLMRWTNDHKVAYLLQQMGTQSAHFAEDYNDADFQLILWNGEPVGRFYVDEPAQEIRLLALDLLADYRGRGIGSALVAQLAERGRRSNRKIVARVETTSEALGWFERSGFSLFSKVGPYCALELTPF